MDMPKIRTTDLSAIERAPTSPAALSQGVWEVLSHSVAVKAKVGEQGRLYGSVTTADIATALTRAVGHAFDKRDIDIPEPIRTLGDNRTATTFYEDVKVPAGMLVGSENGGWKLITNELDRPICWGYVLESQFEDASALNEYLFHPLHQALIADLKPYFEWAAVDYTL